MKKYAKYVLAGLLAVVLLNLCACKNETPKSFEYPTGLKFDKKRYNKVPKKAQLITRSYEKLPSRVVLTDFTPPVADQGQFSTCVAWASAYAGMTTAEALVSNLKEKNSLSTRAFSPYYLYRSCNPNEIKKTYGMYPEDALDWLKDKGVPRRSSNEINSDYASFSMNSYKNSDLFTIESYSRLYDAEDFAQTDMSDEIMRKIIRSIKKSISEKKPVLGAFLVTSEFQNLKGVSDYIPNDIESDFEYERLLGAHAMLIVGYDDNYYQTADGTLGAFLIQNSWGTAWGDRGYIWVNYEIALCYMLGAYEISNKISKVPVALDDVITIDEDEESYDYYNYYDRYDTDDDSYDWFWDLFYDNLCSDDSDYEQEPDYSYDKKEPKVIPVIPEPEPEPEKYYCIFEGEFTLPIYDDDNEEIKVRLNNNLYETSESYDSFTRFQLYMTNKRPCYVYAFASDDSLQKPNKLFPPDNVNALLDYHENTVVYPSEDSCMRLDSHVGTDYLVVLYSLKELNLEDIMKAYNREIKKNPLDVYGAVVNACGKEKVVPAENQGFDKNAVKFAAQVSEVSKASIMPIVIKIKHE